MAIDKFTQQMDARHARRMKSEDRALGVLERREEAAASQVGQLMRDGKIVHYICTQNGKKYKEGERLHLVAYLIRNGRA